jgi:hypothetical protein
MLFLGGEIYTNYVIDMFSAGLSYSSSSWYAKDDLTLLTDVKLDRWVSSSVVATL